VTVQRTGEAFEFDEQLTIIGAQLGAGDVAPAFTLDHWDGNAMQSVTLADTAGTVRLLNIVNSLDTPVCNLETRRWEGLRATLPADIVLYTVSMDLPWAMSRWNADAEVAHQGLSSHRDDAFGRDYGVLIKEWRLLQRAVIVIGADDRVAYAEYVNDQMLEPDYNAAINAAINAASAATAPSDATGV
jgi:thiol peroxidase